MINNKKAQADPGTYATLRKVIMFLIVTAVVIMIIIGMSYILKQGITGFG